MDDNCGEWVEYMGVTSGCEIAGHTYFAKVCCVHKIAKYVWLTKLNTIDDFTCSLREFNFLYCSAAPSLSIAAHRRCNSRPQGGVTPTCRVTSLAWVLPAFTLG